MTAGLNPEMIESADLAARYPALYVDAATRERIEAGFPAVLTELAKVFPIDAVENQQTTVLIVIPSFRHFRRYVELAIGTSDSPDIQQTLAYMLAASTGMPKVKVAEIVARWPAAP